MKTWLVRIGNSRGIRIPKPLIEQCRLGETVELRLEKDCLVISPGRSPREDWGKAFLAAGSSERDERLMDIAEASEFDRKEWEW